MLTKRPDLRLVPTVEQRRSVQLQREVTEVVRKHLAGACDQAWTELAQRQRRPALLTAKDPKTVYARAASRALVTLLTDSVGRLAAIALAPRSGARRARRRSWTEPPHLTAIPGGLAQRASLVR